MQRTFRRIDRAFWLVWLLFPLTFLQSTGFGPATLMSEADIDAAAACVGLAMSPLSPAGQALFWVRFGAEFMVYGTGLALAHWIIHRAASGRVLADEVLWAVRAMGLLLLIWPLVGLASDNMTLYAIAQSPGGPAFAPIWIPDIIVMGFGLFFLMLALVLQEAVTLKQDAALTI